jgi:hypothetical protein
MRIARSWAPFLLILAVGCQRGCVCTACGVVVARAPRDASFTDASTTIGESEPTTASLARFEICNNGVDDDLSGAIDDGCVCTVGERIGCYAGWPATAGIGMCARGEQTCVAHGATGSWGSCVGTVPPVDESCNGLDDDCDAAVDETCLCTPGTTQPCFVGADGRAGRGACVSGLQTCAEVSGPDDTIIHTWGTCEGSVGATDEVCNAVDDDCDGAIDDLTEVCDLIDDDCDGAVDEGDVCAGLPLDRYLTRFWPPTGSGVLPTSARLYTSMESSPMPCLSGEMLLEVAPHDVRCVPTPPSDCPEGTSYEWRGDAWVCVPCGLLVQFGGIYAYERTCAPEPMLACPPGQSPTYREDTRVWDCIPTCNNGQYDQAYYEGMLVCVPC